MPPANPDRRVPRTKRRLKLGLIELLRERDYDQITVQDIVDRADVGRSTFYAHFESKEDLLFADLDDHLMLLTEQVPPGISPAEDARRFRFSLALLRHVLLHRRFFEATILGGSDSRVREISAGIITDMVLVELDRIDPTPAPEPQQRSGLASAQARLGRARAVVGAFMGLLDWWLRSTDNVPAEAVDELFQRFVSASLHSPLVGAPDPPGQSPPRDHSEPS